MWHHLFQQPAVTSTCIHLQTSLPTPINIQTSPTHYELLVIYYNNITIRSNCNKS
ncbi:hypothetical protein Hanom_Chr13g01192071 [Helianthus anomalus]